MRKRKDVTMSCRIRLNEIQTRVKLNAKENEGCPVVEMATPNEGLYGNLLSYGHLISIPK